MISPDAEVLTQVDERDVDALVVARDALVHENKVLENRCKVLVDDVDLATNIIVAFVEQFGPDVDAWEMLIGRVMRDYDAERDDIIEFLKPLDVLPDEIVYQEFEVQVSVPVYFTMTVQAVDSDHASELAADIIGSEWPQSLLDTYAWDMDSFNLSIDAVDEV